MKCCLKFRRIKQFLLIYKIHKRKSKWIPPYSSSLQTIPIRHLKKDHNIYKMSLRKFSLTSSIVGLSLDFGRVMNCTEILPLYIQHRNNLIGLMGGVMTSDRMLFL